MKRRSFLKALGAIPFVGALGFEPLRAKISKFPAAMSPDAESLEGPQEIYADLADCIYDTDPTETPFWNMSK